MLSLEVRRARKGDCLLLHYGKEADPRLVIIDGGPKEVYEHFLKARLLELGTERGAPLVVDVLMVSHVDDDHIQGILDLTKEEIERDSKKEQKLLNVLSFWHNSFEDVIDSSAKAVTAPVLSQFGAASVDGGGELGDDALLEVASHLPHADIEGELEILSSGLQVLASVAQGDRLRSYARRLEWPLNAEFAGGLISSTDDQPAMTADGLSLTVLGPMPDELEALRAMHAKWLKDRHEKKKDAAEALAAYVDPSVTNLSSIVVLAEYEGKRILLTGDARGDRILQGLEAKGLLNKGSSTKFDILKVPHHGSSNNVEVDFFKRLVADHYVFSGNGEHGNPERETLEMLFEARGDETFTVHLTYPISDIDLKRQQEWTIQRGKQQKLRDSKKTVEEKAKIAVREEWSSTVHSLQSFWNALPKRKRKFFQFVSAGSPHIINTAVQ